MVQYYLLPLVNAYLTSILLQSCICRGLYTWYKLLYTRKSYLRHIPWSKVVFTRGTTCTCNVRRCRFHRDRKCDVQLCETACIGWKPWRYLVAKLSARIIVFTDHFYVVFQQIQTVKHHSCKSSELLVLNAIWLRWVSWNLIAHIHRNLKRHIRCRSIEHIYMSYSTNDHVGTLKTTFKLPMQRTLRMVLVISIWFQLGMLLD